MIGLVALAEAVTTPVPAYFPPTLGEPRMICDATRPTERIAALPAERAARYAAFLAAAREPVLAPGSGGRPEGEVLRFTWLRSFDAPVIVRVAWHGKRARLFATRLSGQGGYGPGAIAEQIERELDQSEASALRARIAASDLDQMPARQCQEKIGSDGARWLFEHADRKHYRFVDRWSDDAGALRGFGQYLLGLTGWTFERVY